MEKYIWYELTLECGHQQRQSDFAAQPPQKGTMKYCEECQQPKKVVSFNEWSVPVGDSVEEKQ